jgi:hypothetical protein
VGTYNSNRNVFDPTATASGSLAVRGATSKILNITATALDVVGNIQTIENNITVTQIGYV